MEAAPLELSAAEDWTARLTGALEAQRERLRAFLAGQEERLQKAEAALAEQLQSALELAEREREQSRRAQLDLKCQKDEVAAERASLDKITAQFQSQRAQWEAMQAQAGEQQQAVLELVRKQHEALDQQRAEIDQGLASLVERKAALDHDEEKLRKEQHACALATAELAGEREQIQSQRARFAERERDLETESARLAAWKTEIDRQRTELAQEIKSRRQALLEEEEELKQRLAAAAQGGGEKDEALRRAEDRNQHLTAELKSAREQLDAVCSERIAEGGEATAELAQLRLEHDALLARMVDTERQLKEALSAAAAAGRDSAETQEFRRRYDMAMEDIRELKTENANLKQQLKQRPAQAAGGGVLDWEAEKRRILAALESEGDDAVSAEDRMKIEDVVERTSKLIARREAELSDRDSEIQELKHLLEQQSGNVGEMAVGAAALGQMIDQDEIICEQRERLKQLETNLQAKLRETEIELSLERAKIARERQQMEETRRALEQKGSPAAGATVAGDPAKADKQAKGRWLARLGLKENEEKK